MEDLFAVGTIWFWFLLVGEIILLFILSESEKGIMASLSVIAFVLILQFFGNVDTIGYIKSRPLNVIMFVGLYAVVGAIWATFKWWLYVHDRLDEYRYARDAFLADHGVAPGPVPEQLKKEWKSSFRFKDGLGNVPSVSENKSRITRWISYWPISLTWTCINDFVRRLATAIYNSIAGFLQGIANRVFASVAEDTN